MEHVMLTKLREAGCDMDGTLERFMNNEMLCMKFLRKFPEDTTFGEMQKAFAQGDAEEFFKAAHTMKGVSGNLGLTAFMMRCSLRWRRAEEVNFPPGRIWMKSKSSMTR